VPLGHGDRVDTSRSLPSREETFPTFTSSLPAGTASQLQAHTPPPSDSPRRDSTGRWRLVCWRQAASRSSVTESILHARPVVSRRDLSYHHLIPTRGHCRCRPSWPRSLTTEREANDSSRDVCPSRIRLRPPNHGRAVTELQLQMLDIGLRQLLSATFGSVQGRERQYIIVDLTVTETPGFLRETARGDVGLTRRFTTNTVPTLPTLSTFSALSPIGQARRQAAASPSDFTSPRRWW